MLEKLLERRVKMTKLHARGISLADTVNQLSQEYNISKQGLYKDWKLRKRWLEGILECKDPQTFFLDLLSRHKEIYHLAILEHLKADNSNAKIGALRLIRDVNKDFFEMVAFQDLTKRVEALEEVKR